MKDELFRVGAVVKFDITKDLVSEVKGAPAKYITDFEEEERLKIEQLKLVSGANKVQEVKT